MTPANASGCDIMPTPLRSGEVLRSRYKIRRIIGQGGMGSLYLADDLRLEGRECALKEVEHDRTLPPDMVRQARDQFLREATVLARLDHPNLPKVSDYFSIGGRDYLVMDYVPGKDLRTLMQEARQRAAFLDENEVLGWASQLADALSYLHSQKPPILHRDVKPENIVVDGDGEDPGGAARVIGRGHFAESYDADCAEKPDGGETRSLLGYGRGFRWSSMVRDSPRSISKNPCFHSIIDGPSGSAMCMPPAAASWISPSGQRPERSAQLLAKRRPLGERGS